MTVDALTISGKPNGGLIYVLDVIYPSIMDGPIVTTVDLGTIGSRSIAGFEEYHGQFPPPETVSATQYFATEDWTTLDGDTFAPNRWYDGRLSDAGSTARSVALAAVDSSSIVTALGSLSLENGDGALDNLPSNSLLINAPAQLSVGYRGDDRSTYQVVSTGYVQSANISLVKADLGLRGQDAVVNNTVFDEVYLGTGGLEGGADLADTRKPYILGFVVNIQPVLIDPLLYIFQGHAGGPLDAITVVRFGGIPMLFTADFPDLASLTAAPVAVGEYATCLANGLVKAGLTQAGVDGSFTLTMNARQALYDAAQIAEYLAIQLNSVTALPIDAASFAALVVALPNYFYGRFITEPLSYDEVLSDVMRNLNAYWGVTREGAIAAAILTPPEGIPDPPIAIWDENDILEIDRVSLPSGFEWPHKERTLRWRKNWSPQTNLAAIVNDASLGQEYKDVTVEAPVQYSNALTPDPIDTNLISLSAVQNLGARLLAAHGEPRQMYVVTVSVFSTWPGVLNKINVTYPRFDLRGGRDLVSVAVTEDYGAGTMQVVLWG